MLDVDAIRYANQSLHFIGNFVWIKKPGFPAIVFF